jgi:hypothetical protein
VLLVSSRYHGPLQFWPWAIRDLLWLVPAHVVAVGGWVVWGHVEEGVAITIGLPFEVLAAWLFGIWIPLLCIPPGLVFLAVTSRFDLTTTPRKLLAALLAPVIFGSLALAVAATTTEALPTRGFDRDVAVWLIALPVAFGLLVQEMGKNQIKTLGDTPAR